MNSALQNLTEQYTDSENEDQQHEDDEDEKMYSDPEEKQIQGEILKKSKALRLVSYNDAHFDDDEDDELHAEQESIQEQQQEDINEEEKFAKYTKKYGFQLPLEPKTKPTNSKLQEMVTKMTNMMEQNPNYDLNQYIQQKKSFRNPSIYDKLIQFCGINELSTNFSKDFYDTSIYGPESFYEELAKSQKIEMDKQEKQKKENIKTEILEGVSSKEGQKRKSKWDQQTTGKLVASSSSSSNGKAAPTTTVINAFGNLKKPKI